MENLHHLPGEDLSARHRAMFGAAVLTLRSALIATLWVALVTANIMAPVRAVRDRLRA